MKCLNYQRKRGDEAAPEELAEGLEEDMDAGESQDFSYFSSYIIVLSDLGRQ